MASSYDVVIAGAGITGASTAWHLKKLGVARVLLLERRHPAAGGTGKSAAIIRQHYSTALLAGLTKEAIAMFRAMPEELGQGGGYVRSGWFMLLPPESVAGAEKNVALQKSVGVDTRFLSQSEIAERMPWLNPEGVARVIHEPDGGYADPVQSTEAYVRAFEALGGEVRLRHPARGLLRAGDRITGVLTDDGPIEAGAVVNAAGPWAHLLARSADIDLPLRVVREQDSVWQARPDRPLPAGSISDAVDAIYVRPLGGARFIVGRGFPKDYYDVDPNNFKETADEDFVVDVLERLRRRFPPFAGVQRLDTYAALYDVTPDWYPFIGPRQDLAGYYDACGGSGHGFKLGPAIGRRLAAWIVDGRADEDFAGLSYDRIEAGRLYNQTYGGNRG
jgi:glycine/D-amino acid oxidase-like deaminating enzyme